MTTARRVPSRSTVADAAAVVRRLLDAIDSGEIEADSAEARALYRRLEGAVAAWEQASKGRTGEASRSD
jgi:hypothetical protein